MREVKINTTAGEQAQEKLNRYFELLGPLYGSRSSSKGFRDFRQVVPAQSFQFLRNRFVLFHRFKPCLAVTGTEDETRHGIVVALVYGIELVVMAAGTGNGQTKEGLAHHIDFVFELLAFVLTEIHRGVI